MVIVVAINVATYHLLFSVLQFSAAFTQLSSWHHLQVNATGAELLFLEDIVRDFTNLTTLKETVTVSKWNALNSSVSHSETHRCRLWVWYLLHLRAEAGHQDAVAGPGQHWPDVGASASDLAAQWTPLRRPDRAKQGRDGRQARRGSGEDLEALIWHPSSPHGPRTWLLHYHQQGKIWYLQYVHTTKKLYGPLRKKYAFVHIDQLGLHTVITKKRHDWNWSL